ncbi:unnamed protein product, partial [Amoebophrya sp. A120]|eukprot:GSA120T00003614001.1
MARRPSSNLIQPQGANAAIRQQPPASGVHLPPPYRPRRSMRDLSPSIMHRYMYSFQCFMAHLR